MKSKKGIRLLSIICILVMLCTMMPVSVSAASAKSRAMKAYRTMLSKKSITCPSRVGVKVKASDCSFAIAYIDNNSVPELIVYNPNSSHAAGYGTIYTYKSGKVVKIRDLTLELYEGPFVYYKKTGTFIDHHFGNGGWHITYVYKLSSGKATMKLRQTLLDSRMRDFWANGYGDNWVKVHGKTWVKISGNGKETKITKSAYKKSLSSLAKNKKSTKAKFYKNTAKNRTKILK